DLERCDDVDLQESLRLDNAKVRIPRPVLPMQLRLGDEDGYRLHLYPELVARRNGRMRPSGDYLLFDPDKYFFAISGFLRLSSGDSLTLGRKDREQRLLFQYPDLVDDRHLRLKLSEKGLALRNKSGRRGACLAPLTAKDQIERLVHWRQDKLARLAAILGGGIKDLSSGDALDLIERVIALMGREPCRVQDSRGAPGGLLALPDGPAPIFVGDLHANIDSLLVILTQNAFLEALEDGSALLVLLGDAVHPDEPGKEDQMDSSILMMDLIFRLKLRFPERFFYLRGNHDSFAEEVSKGGVPQGLLWEQALHDRRGPNYKKAMAELYRRLPYVALSNHYAACHAGPPTCKVSREALIDIDEHPKLRHQLTHGRLRGPQAPSGYSRGDVTRFRRRLGLDADAPVLVGHTPLSVDGSLWLDAGGIKNHHILFGANPRWVGLVTRVGNRLLPLRYPTEPLTAVLNQFVRTGRGIRL
ncbi:MAG: metallophosphoesterase, partial [Chromatiaceae bacterium]